MAKGYMQEIRERILSAEEGSVFQLLILRILQTQIQCAPLYIGLFKMEYCAGFLMVFMKNQNIANFWMNMWRQTRKRWRTHWHEVITGRLPHVGIQH